MVWLKTNHGSKLPAAALLPQWANTHTMYSKRCLSSSYPLSHTSPSPSASTVCPQCTYYICPEYFPKWKLALGVAGSRLWPQNGQTKGWFLILFQYLKHFSSLLESGRQQMACDWAQFVGFGSLWHWESKILALQTFNLPSHSYSLLHPICSCSSRCSQQAVPSLFMNIRLVWDLTCSSSF